MWRLEATQAAKRADLKQGPLSVTIRKVLISPLWRSVRPSIQVTPSSRSTSVRATWRNPMASVVVLVTVTCRRLRSPGIGGRVGAASPRPMGRGR